MKLLVYGAGVLGSFYAAKLHAANIDVSILARGQRLIDINQNGIIIENVFMGERIEQNVPVIDSLQPDDNYDIVIVIMRKNQIASILPILSQNKKIETVLFMGNNGKGSKEYIEAIGKKRVLLGFPSAGGRREGHIIKLVASDKSSIILGEIDGSITPRLKQIIKEFNKARIRVKMSKNMDAWLKTHLALVLPLAGGIYFAGGDNYQLAKDKEGLILVLNAIREGMRVLKTLEIPILPKKFKILLRLPRSLIVKKLSKGLGTESGELALRDHAMAAQDEMLELADEFKVLIEKSGISTPAFNELYKHFKMKY
ncbi:MAG: ketopantoate reductase family protein [Candidatus Thorarchaeota archaeon]